MIRLKCIAVQLKGYISFSEIKKQTDERIDTRLLKQSNQQAEENRHVLCQIVRAVEFLAKQALPFRGHSDYGVDFSDEDVNRGNFVATLQLS